MWESGKKGVEVFVWTLRLASKVAPRNVVEDRAGTGRGLPVASNDPGLPSSQARDSQFSFSV